VLKFGPRFARKFRPVAPRRNGISTLVQRRRNKFVAVKLMRTLLKKQGFAPEVLVTDKLRS
jgi:transposase-like protein